MRLILGDCLEILRTLDANSVDAVVTDPPYGLSFMGKKWDYDVPSVDVWREVLRVLKPGGHLLSFGGTRTYHRMVVNVEDAGFEIRDQVQWIYGSGFPKSLDVSKAIDKVAGAEREVVGSTVSGKILRANGQNERPYQNGQDRIECLVTAPATDDARTWQGWGTALKPANEPIVLARKPLERGLTVAENVLKWGTGAINVDASRIASDGEHKRPFQPTNNDRAILGKQAAFMPTNAEGRWPANVLFDESAAEMLDAQSGVLKNRANKGASETSKDDGATLFGKGMKRQSGAEYNYGTDGGASRFFFVVREEKQWQNQRDSKLVKLAANNFNYDEAHLNSVLEAVRTNFKNDHLLLHSLDSIPDFKKCILLQNLASLAESPENIGIIEITQSLLKLFGSVHHVIDENTNSESQKENNAPTRFLYQAKASKRERNEGLNIANGETCTHPTVKPIKLMEYLIKLITPPGGTVLDPFMGSGSTGVAAKGLGFAFIGCEMNAEYIEIARRRIG